MVERAAARATDPELSRPSGRACGFGTVR